MFWIDFGGCDRSSRTTSTTLRPSRPPAAIDVLDGGLQAQHRGLAALRRGRRGQVAVEADLDVLGQRLLRARGQRDASRRSGKTGEDPLVFIVVSCVFMEGAACR